MNRYLRFALFFLALGIAGCSSTVPVVTVFYAPCFSPIIDQIKPILREKMGIVLKSEVSGSQVVIRKVVDLGRDCDLMLVADAGLFKRMAPQHTRWRIEFAHDEIVLGIGIRARRSGDAENDWTTVLHDPEIILGRVDENLGPIGYRTLLLAQLAEQKGYSGLVPALLDKKNKVLDHVDHLAAMLKSGDVEYGFLYRTTCRQYDIRYISLPATIHFGSPEYDYSSVQMTIDKSGMEVKGSLITYGLSMPDSKIPNADTLRLIQWLLQSQTDLFTEKGYSFFKPRFYGTPQAYLLFQAYTDYGGDF